MEVNFFGWLKVGELNTAELLTQAFPGFQF